MKNSRFLSIRPRTLTTLVPFTHGVHVHIANTYTYLFVNCMIIHLSHARVQSRDVKELTDCQINLTSKLKFSIWSDSKPTFLSKMLNNSKIRASVKVFQEESLGITFYFFQFFHYESSILFENFESTNVVQTFYRFFSFKIGSECLVFELDQTHHFYSARMVFSM